MGQLVAGRFQQDGQWYRALIEGISHKCRDVVILYVDYGNRESRQMEDIRLLDETLTTTPAQAVRCVYAGPLSELWEAIKRSRTNMVQLTVEQMEEGAVGRLPDEPELTLRVRLCGAGRKEDGDMSVGSMSTSSSLPSWMTPHPESEEMMLDWPAVVHKVQPSPTPPPVAAPSLHTKQQQPQQPQPQPMKPKKRFPACRNAASSASGGGITGTDAAARSIPTGPPSSAAGQENHYRTRVHMAHTESPGEFYVRLEVGQKTYVHLTKQLNDCYGSARRPDKLPANQLEPNVMCVVFLESAGSWNRCRIVKTATASSSPMVTVFLMDVGRTLTVEPDRLYQLDKPSWRALPVLASRCRLWGVGPAGHVTNWSRSSTERMLELFRQSTALFQQMYYTIEEESEEDGGGIRPVHYVRLYMEYVQIGGPMENDKVLTCGINDELLERGLVLRKTMPVTVQPLPRRWLPSLPLPPETDADVVCVNDQGRVYVHRTTAPGHHLELIGRLLNWHYNKVEESLALHWEPDDPCVFWYKIVWFWNSNFPLVFLKIFLKTFWNEFQDQ